MVKKAGDCLGVELEIKHYKNNASRTLKEAIYKRVAIKWICKIVWKIFIFSEKKGKKISSFFEASNFVGVS